MLTTVTAGQLLKNPKNQLQCLCTSPSTHSLEYLHMIAKITEEESLVNPGIL